MDLTEILNTANLSDRGRRRPHNEDSSQTKWYSRLFG
jgi:hypothetical protein